jgi:dGTPase
VPHAQALEATEPQGVGRRFLDHTQPSLEAQLCNLADEIAYNAHDLDDGVRSGLLSWDQLSEMPLFSRHWQAAKDAYPALTPKRQMFEGIRRMLSEQVYDVIDSTRQALAEANITDLDAVRRHSRPLCVFSPSMRAQSTQLKRYLFKHLYRHPHVAATMDKAQSVVIDLFEVYALDPHEMPAKYTAREATPRAAADYIAGMTDRFALKEHQRLTGQEVLFSVFHST